MEYKFKKGDLVKLPFNETGVISLVKDILWGFQYVVKIRKATFNKTNQKVDFKEGQMEFLN